MQRKLDVVTLARQAATQIVDGMNTLRALEREITANGGATWLDASAFQGAHAGLDSDDVVAVVFTTKDALDGVLAQGHATNLYKLHE